MQPKAFLLSFQPFSLKFNDLIFVSREDIKNNLLLLKLFNQC